MERKTFIRLIAWMPLALWAGKRNLPQTPKEEWVYATDAQKAFALRCIRYGQLHRPRRGHSLAGLAWMESSLGAKTDHGEEQSYGPFGLGLVTAKHIRKNLRKDPALGDLEDWGDDKLIEMLETFEYAADMAIWLFEYHRKWFIERKYSSYQAWKYAAQKYAGWKRWSSRRSYGRVFNARVKFLKTNTDWGEA